MPRKGKALGCDGHDLRGLQVRYSDTVEEMSANGHGKRTGRFAPPGWFVFVQFYRGPQHVWEAVLALRFVRERDARLAKAGLEVAGLDSAKRMKAAGGETVIRTAFEALQW
jgi:hypothetical protein